MVATGVGRIEGRFARSRDGRVVRWHYKWELIYEPGPWRGLDDVEFATMTYVDGFNIAGAAT